MGQPLTMDNKAEGGQVLLFALRRGNKISGQINK
jgi:hypothetical protein